MASSPVKFFSVFLLASVLAWVVFTFASRMLAWFLSRVLNASVSFRVAGFNCLRDVHIKFRKGSIESVSVGEIKLSFRKSLVKLGVSVISKDPKLQLLISDIELVMRPSGQSKKTAKSRKPSSTGKGKWFVITSATRFLSVWVTDLVVKVPKAGIEVKELKLDIFKIAGRNQSLEVKLHLVPLSLNFGDYGSGTDPVCHNQPDCSQSDQAFPVVSEKIPAPFVCDDVMITCNFGHEKEKGIRIKNLDLTCGDVMVNLDESLFSKSSASVDKSTYVPGDNTSATGARKSGKSKAVLAAIKKQVYALPEKVSFSVPKLDAKFMHLGENITIENNITGIHLSSVKLPSHDETGEATSHFDVQMDLNEIHLLTDGGTSLLEILKVATAASIDVPVESDLPVRAEVDAKLGGTQCNLDVSRLMPWMHLYMSRSKKEMSLTKQSSHTESPQTNGIKAVMWTCILSAPEMTIMFYSLNGVVLYHGCSQSSHLFANNIASKGIQVNTELGEIQLHMEDEYREFVKENVFGVDAYSGSLLNISRLSFDWGYHEVERQENPELSPWTLISSVDISGMVVQFGFKHIEALLLNLLSFKTLFKKLSSSAKRSVGKRSVKKKLKGTKIFKFNMEKCSISYAGETSVLETTIADPKRVNFGSQGGEVIISVSADGTPRKASILSDLGHCKNMKFSTSLVVSHLTVCIDKEKESTRIELQRAKTVFEEYPEDNKPSVKVTLFDLQNAKVIKRLGRVADLAMCMFLSATDIAVHWDLDVYLALYESFARFKSILRNMNPKVSENKMNSESSEVKSIGLDKDISLGKRELIIAVDVEVLNVTAELADGVKAKLYVQSIFTENAKIGLLMEGLVLRFNEARVLRSTRLQISRIPFQKDCLTNPMTDVTGKRDWVIQGLDVYVCMPFRLPLRAIQDAIEDTVRGMKLIIAAKTSLIHPSKTQNPKKPKSNSSNLWSVRFVIRKLTAYIEEEPIQGWLDEHYNLMRKVACESDVRLRFLDEVKSGSGNSDLGPTETEAFDMADVDKLKEEVHKKTFWSYYSACQKMVFSEGSGCSSCSIGYQAGFRPSLRRSSLLSLCGTELDVTLTRIGGGVTEMVNFIKGLDSAAQEKNIPFSRFYGSDISVNAGSLVLQLRDYTFPLFAGTGGKCQGRIVFAQQATCFQPQIYQEIFIGRWHKVRMLRSASGTTPPVKMYSNLPIYFDKGEISFGVGYEPSFADISYAFQVALRKTNLSTRPPKDQPIPPKKEKNLPWWDDMRYYIHGKIVLYFNQTEWNILATTNPYERLDKLQIISDYMDITQTDGHVDISAKEFKMNISSLQSLVKNCSLRILSDVTKPFIYTPNFSLNVIMDWECESGNPLNHYLHALPIEGEPRKRVLDPFRSTSLSLRWHFSLRPPQSLSEGIETIYDSSQKLNIHEFPTMNLGGHDLAWVFKWWGLNYSPPHKLRSFSRWPRFGIPRAARSGNLSLDKVMTEFCLRVDATPCCIKHVPLGEDDPASGLTFRMSKLRYELYYSRGKQKYSFESKRETLDLVYRGLDLHVPKVYLNQDDGSSAPEDYTSMRGGFGSLSDKQRDEGFLLSSDYFTIRRQAPKADPVRLLAWQEAGRRNNLEMTYVRSEFENGSESDHTRSDLSDDDGFNVVIADNCQRVFVYGLKLLWTIENRDAVWSWVGAISKAFESPKPSPSRQYAQRKIMEERQDALKTAQDDSNVASTSQGVPINAAQIESVASTSSPPPKGSSSFIDIPGMLLS